LPHRNIGPSPLSQAHKAFPFSGEKMTVILSVVGSIAAIAIVAVAQRFAP
jgi:hypothetical protein